MFVALPMAVEVTLIERCVLFLNCCKENVNEVFHDPFSSGKVVTLTFNLESYRHSIRIDHICRVWDGKQQIAALLSLFHACVRRPVMLLRPGSFSEDEKERRTVIQDLIYDNVLYFLFDTFLLLLIIF